MNEMREASIPLAAYFVSSALAQSITMIGAPVRVNGSYTSRMSSSVNAFQKTRLFSKMRAHFGGLKGKIVAVWGLAFKPKTDDMREAPSVALINALLAAGAKVQAYDPEASRVAKGLFGSRVGLASGDYDALNGADCLAITL